MSSPANWRSPRGERGKPKSNNSCRYFAQNGSCKYGSRCTFAHNRSAQSLRDRSSSQPSPPSSNPRSVAMRQPQTGNLNQWKRLLQHPFRRSRPHATMVSQFLKLGLELMDGDIGARQETIKLLATDPGLEYIRDVAERHILGANTEISKLALWNSQVSCLFRLVTHHALVNSAVLEQEVAKLYNFLRGIDGSRMKIIFNFAIRVGRASPQDRPIACDIPSKTAVAELSLAVLAKMINYNTTDIINETLEPVVSELVAFIPSNPPAEEEFSKLQAERYADYIRQWLDVGKQLPTYQPARSALPGTLPSFQLRRDLPGHLSTQGPRHDNDHADIRNIAIMPTWDEIMSPRAEYLPTNDPSQWHIAGIRGRLDREFRLLREDTVGQLRDAVRSQLEALRNARELGNRGRDKNSLRMFTYSSATVLDICFDKRLGLELTVKFQQPASVEKMSTSRRREWWMQTKRLQPGGLVCAIDTGGSGSVLFLVVADSTLRACKDESANVQPAQGPEGEPPANVLAESSPPPSLADDPHFGFVKLNLVDVKNQDVGKAMRWYSQVGPHGPRHLVEFPGVLLPSFRHTLEALQKISENPNVPFASLLGPTHLTGQEAEIPPPHYTLKPGFYFDLKPITSDDQDFRHYARGTPKVQDLSDRSTLDPTQAQALLDALSRSLSLIQGPPGTGKSYTGEKFIQVLLANKAKAAIGPIICVCYTNHALDQLMEHLHEGGIKKMIRIGSRSKSEILENLALRVVAKGEPKTRTEKGTAASCHETFGDVQKELGAALNDLSKYDSMRSIKAYLAREHPHHHKELFGVDEDGWQTVHHEPERIVENWLRQGQTGRPLGQGGAGRPLDALLDTSLSAMTKQERAYLHRYWLKEISNEAILRIIAEHNRFRTSKETFDSVNQDVDLRCLEGADIIGVTTTGLARNLKMLRKLSSKVMVCEEAGEVLEAHILTALLPSLEHVVLIGDHQQLRPQVQNYDLRSDNPHGVQYSFDTSLFERLVDPPHPTDLRIPFSRLETQRRMDPSISELIRSTLYPSLQDGENVMNYPEVSGIKRRLFWLHHEQPEDGAASKEPLSTSHTNKFEIEITTALVSHLVKQGIYGDGDIAVITPYLGQMNRLRNRMASMFEICLNDRDLSDLEALTPDGDKDAEAPAGGPPISAKKTTLLKRVRVATVDNFQGEEAKVVVISLVRSNDQQRCGFLSTSNRINVLLSRAKHGMYIIGNANTYSNVFMWSTVIDLLQEGGNLGPALELQCPRHANPEKAVLASQAEHFQLFSPDGGCLLPCDKRLQCGHSCTGRCHADAIHYAKKCLQPCPRPKKGCTHPCLRPCGDPCEAKCSVWLKDVNLTLPCGHVMVSAFCWETQDLKSVVCREKVQRVVPDCNHAVTVQCHVDVKEKSYRCTVRCDADLPCGHKCRRQCWHCRTRNTDGEIEKTDHGPCVQPCGRSYQACRHVCEKPCHPESPCPPCAAPCEVRCSHSKCSKACHEPCVPCAEEKCASRCPHSSCTMPCAAPCDWVPCSNRCQEILGCGHQCPSVCGELCPDAKYCQQCGTDSITSTIVDLLEFRRYDEVDLYQDPCIFPDCGHFLTVSSMDGQMAMGDHYNLDDDEHPISISALSLPFSKDEAKVCPQCRGSLRNISRYGRIVRRAMLDEATKKFCAWSNAEHLKLAERLEQLQSKLDKQPVLKKTLGGRNQASKTVKLASTRSRSKQATMINDDVGGNRYQAIINLRRRISSYNGQVKKEEQPFQRVADLVQFANRRNNRALGELAEFAFDETVLQVRGHILAEALLLQCDLVILSDYAAIRREIKKTRAAAVKGPQPQPETETEIETEIRIDLSQHIADCGTLIGLTQRTKHNREELKAHVCYAQLCALAKTFIDPESLPQASSGPKEGAVDNNATSPTHGELNTSSPASALMDKYSEDGLAHASQARALLDRLPSLQEALRAGLLADLEAAEAALRPSGPVYQPVSVAERRAVYRAMAAELWGTGHWYTCANGHPFTVGECGMPMEQTRCPECGAPVGGQHHRAAEGVRRDTEIEALAREVGGVGI